MLMLSDQQKLNRLTRHIKHVYDNSEVIANGLIENGEFDFARQLLHNAQIHDASKFLGLEWDHMHDYDDPLFQDAFHLHVTTNPHHPEYWGDIHNVPRIYLGEMIGDWSARNAELKTSKCLVQWIEEDASHRFHFNETDKVYGEIYEFINLLLEPAFA